MADTTADAGRDPVGERIQEPGSPNPDDAPFPDRAKTPGRRRWHVLLVLPAILVVTASVLLTINLMGIGPTWFDRVVVHGPAWKNFVLDTFILCLLLGLVVFLTGRFWIPAGLFAVVGFLVAFSNGTKLDVRNEPIYPSDLAIAGNTGFLGDMVAKDTLIKIALAAVGIVLVTVVLALVLRRWFPRVRRSQDPQFWKLLTITRLVCALICFVMLFDAVYFNTPGNLWHRAYDRIGSHWTPWDQDRNYRRNGFVGGFLYNLNGPTMPKPPGYSEAAMRDVVTRYTRLAEQANATRDPHALDDVNIVVILSEAFSDPTQVKGITVDGDPIPFTRDLMSRTFSGKMLAQNIGGGTANMEFEVLTGLSLAQYAPQLSTPYQMLLPRFSTFPGAVRYLGGEGHEPLAIHPYSTRMYKRTTAYPVLGFDDFIHNTTMQERAKVPHGRYISDASAFDEVRYQIDHSDEPAFINLVTMQNHYPWAKEFGTPWPISGVEGHALQQVGRYTRGINISDGAMRDFLAELSKSSEKTAVIFYGDHLPGAYPAKIKAQNSDRSLHETPFFMWTNFKKLQHSDQPTTSPIYFLPELLDQIGAPIPPMYALLDALHKEIPAMEQGRYIDAANTEVAYDQLSPTAKQLLRDYRLVQYDLSAGKQYSKKAMYAAPSG